MLRKSAAKTNHEERTSAHTEMASSPASCWRCMIAFAFSSADLYALPREPGAESGCRGGGGGADAPSGLSSMPSAMLGRY